MNREPRRRLSWLILALLIMAGPLGIACSAGDSTTPDGTEPEIIPVITGTVGFNGWYTDDVTVAWSVSDAESGISWTEGCGTSIISIDTANAEFSCQATNGAGRSNRHAVHIKRDATPPTTVVGLPDRPPDQAGWYTRPLTVTFSGDDALSGTNLASCTRALYRGPGDFDAVMTGTCSDRAGNISQAGKFSFKYGYVVVLPWLSH